MTTANVRRIRDISVCGVQFPGAGNQEVPGSVRHGPGAPSSITEQRITPKLSGARQQHFLTLTDCVGQALREWLVSTVNVCGLGREDSKGWGAFAYRSGLWMVLAGTLSWGASGWASSVLASG